MHILFSATSLNQTIATGPIFGTAFDPSLTLVAPSGAVFSDSFDRANNTNIATGSSVAWLERDFVGGTSTGWEISGNALTLSTDGYSTAIAGDVGANDHYAECTVSGIVATSVIHGPMVRANATSSTGYCSLAFSDRVRLYKISGGTLLTLNETDIVADSMIGTNTIRLEIIGTTLKIYVNSVVQLTHTDASTPYTTGQYVGLVGNGIGGSIDNFEADII